MDFINGKYSEYYEDYKRLYPRGGADKEYKSKAHTLLKNEE